MLSKKYRLSYLSLFYEDLDEKITYIVEKLKNPKAASDLLDSENHKAQHDIGAGKGNAWNRQAGSAQRIVCQY